MDVVTERVSFLNLEKKKVTVKDMRCFCTLHFTLFRA